MRLIMLEIALDVDVWSWQRKQFWFETLLDRNFVAKWWKENLRISRGTFEYIVRVAGLDLAYCVTMKTNDARH